MKRKKHDHHIPLIETILFIVGLFIAIGIALPYYVKKEKAQNLDQHFYKNVVTNNIEISKQYDEFWNAYDIRLKTMGDLNANKLISVQEKESFDDGFFGTYDLTYDPVTKIVNKANGISANPKSLICHINAYYPDRAWIQPVCPPL